MPGVGEILSFEDPKGTSIELFAEARFLDEDRTPKAFTPLKLGHLAFKVNTSAFSNATDPDGVSGRAMCALKHLGVAMPLYYFHQKRQDGTCISHVGGALLALGPVGTAKFLQKISEFSYSGA